jgi:transmembrane sensor
MSARPESPPSQRALDEAAAWLVRLNDQTATPDDWASCERWRSLQPENEAAWARAARLQDAFRSLSGLRASAPQRPAGRRRQLAIWLALMPGTALLWRGWQWSEGVDGPNWLAAHRTGVGERREIALTPEVRVQLNTASAIDARFDADQGLIRLRSGEILVRADRTRTDAPPLMIQTAHGSAELLGNQTVVARQTAAWTRIGALDGAVRLTPAQAPAEGALLAAGHLARLTGTQAEPLAAGDAATASAWANGMFLADRTPLAELALELARYRDGTVRCDPTIAAWPISGAFPVGSRAATDRALAMLAATRPIAIERGFGGWWVVLHPARARVGANTA